jgi:hypothetical protein
VSTSVLGFSSSTQFAASPHMSAALSVAGLALGAALQWQVAPSDVDDTNKGRMPSTGTKKAPSGAVRSKMPNPRKVQEWPTLYQVGARITTLRLPQQGRISVGREMIELPATMCRPTAARCEGWDDLILAKVRGEHNPSVPNRQRYAKSLMDDLTRAWMPAVARHSSTRPSSVGSDLSAVPHSASRASEGGSWTRRHSIPLARQASSAERASTVEENPRTTYSRIDRDMRAFRK